VDRYRAVTAAAVQAFARDQLSLTSRVVVHAVPGTPEPLAQVAAPPAPKPGAGTGGRGTESGRAVESHAADARCDAHAAAADARARDVDQWPDAHPERTA
jgi:hypothetical protein